MLWPIDDVRRATGGRVLEEPGQPAPAGAGLPKDSDARRAPAPAGAGLPKDSHARQAPAPAPAAGPVFTSVATDSRHLAAGALFVPVVAERDGHDFVAAAVAAGAAGYLVAAGHPLLRALPPGTAIEVPDTAEALLALGRAGRDRLEGPVVGITGSVGKTSTKDLAAAVLGRLRVVTASPRSFNNELGVPLTLANAAAGTEVTVVEMGARGVGHVAALCRLSRPTIGVVTAVAAVHTEVFGSIDAVAKAKGELVEALPAAGTAVLNADDPRVAAMVGRTDAAVVRYSASGAPGVDVVAEDVRVDDALRPSFLLRSPWGGGPVSLAVRGVHQVPNSLAAAAVAFLCGIPPAEVVAGLAAAAVSPWRMELGRTASGAAVLNDAYNANPVSVVAALRALAALPARRRLAVLGEMAELGEEGPAEHRAVAALAAEVGVGIVAVGTDAYGVDPVDGPEAAVAALGPLGPGDAVLVKGSRVTGLERVALALLEGEGRQR